MKIKRTLAAVVSAAMITAIIPTVMAEGNTPPMPPTGLLTNELPSPDNVEIPTFSWLVNDSDYNEVQTAYEIVVTDSLTGEEVWYSGKVESSEQSNIKYAGEELKPGRSYSWQVKTWDKDNEESPYSDKAEFSTGLGDEDWEATWIKASDIGSSKNAFRYLRKEVPLYEDKKVVKALAYFACCHDYALNINGTYIGRGQSFDYLDKTDYQGWDITEAVSDSNSIAVGITARWYGGGQGRYKGTPGLLGHIKIYYEDETEQIIVTDGTWKTANTPFGNQGSKASMRNSEGDFIENYDARNELDGWTSAGYDDSEWSDAEEIGVHPVADSFSHVEAELGHVTEYDMKPISITKLADGSTLADFGVVIPARFSIDFKNGVSGTTLKIQTGYELKTDGSIDTSKQSRQSTDMSFTYIQRDGAQTYNSWDHLGFRYIQIPDAGEELTVDDITVKIVHAEVPEGRETTFESSDEMLNQVYEMMKRSALYSVQNSFVDTPTREKGQFLGDAVNISAATMLASFERTATKKAILQFLDSADRYWNSGEDLGRYNSVYPNGDDKRDIPDYSLMMPEWVMRYYMETGDKELLEIAYPYMKATAGYVENHISADTGLVTKLTGGGGSYEYGIVDWPADGRFGYDWDGTKEGARTTINMWSVNVFDNVAEMGEILGLDEEAFDYAVKAQTLRDTINTKLINSDGVYCDGLNAAGEQVTHAGQHSTSYALAFGVAPEENIENMAEYVGGMGMKQGPMTADILLNGLLNSGEGSAALKLLTNTEDYGWAKLINEGYTFTWEAWQYRNEHSQSHGWGAAALKPIVEGFTGVKITEAGAAKVKITPVYGILDSLNASVVTERGNVDVAYSGRGTEYNLKVKIPANVSAEIELPIIGNGGFFEVDGRELTNELGEAVQTITVGSGEYEFMYDGEETIPLIINNPENIPAHAVIEGNSYDLPLDDRFTEAAISTLKIVSDDELYEYAYSTGDVLSVKIPPENAVSVEGIETDVHFKFVAPTSKTSILTINGSEGGVIVNGEEHLLPYTADFEKGREAVIDIVVPEGKIFNGYTGDPVTGSPVIVVMNGDVTLNADFIDNGTTTLVSQGKTATALNSLENDSWGIARLTDGVTTGTGYSSEVTYDDSADVSDVKPYVQVDLGEIKEVSSVILYPRNDSTTSSKGSNMFPQDFTVEVSEDGESFIEVASIVGAADDAVPDTIRFDSVPAQYIRIVFTKLCSSTTAGKRRLQLAELEVYSGELLMTPVEEIVFDKTEADITTKESVRINAEILPTTADNNDIIWFIQNEDGTISDKAELIISGSNAELVPLETGTVIVSARAADGSGILSECRVNIDYLGDEIGIERNAVTAENLEYSIDVSKEGVLITALYDADGRLIMTDSEEVSKGMVNKTISVTEEMSKGTTKFMLWDYVSRVEPVSNYTEIKWDTSKPDIVWDLRNVVSEKTAMNSFTDNTTEYNGLTICGGGASDYLDSEVGFHVNGKSATGSGAMRYIAITSEYDGILEIVARRSYNNAALYVSERADLSGGKVINGLSNPSSFIAGNIEVESGKTYYLYCVNSGMEIQQLRLCSNPEM